MTGITNCGRFRLKSQSGSGAHGGQNRYHTDPYLFYFDKGEHIISLVAVREPMAVDYIELYRKKK